MNEKRSRTLDVTLDMPGLSKRPGNAGKSLPHGRNIVEVVDLRKVFQRKVARSEGGFWARLWRRGAVEPFVAVDGVSFDIREGEIFGLLGPNGAGKTTTIRMLCTLLDPSGGSARINGYDVVREADLVRQSLGAVLTGERSIYWKLTGRENLEYFAVLYHIPRAVARQRIQELLDRLELASRADENVEGYSSGMKQRIAIAKALLANPPVVLLNERTIGLDRQSARNLRELILEIKRAGRTVLLTTHYMEEADQLCDRVAIIDHGRIVALDSPAALKRTIRAEEVVRLEVGVDGDDSRLVGGLAGRGRVAHRERENGTLNITVHCDSARDFVPAAFDIARLEGAVIRHVEVVPV